MAVYRNQIGTVDTARETSFYNDVLEGLSSTPKYLKSKYFYDAAGDALFQQIMQLPEYYVTRCEKEIFLFQTEALAAPALNRFGDFDVVELGAGDASKSVHLLQYFSNRDRNFSYYPVDISQNIIQTLETEIPNKLPGVKVVGLNGDYFEMISQCYRISAKRKLVLFLGSNIGNFQPAEAEEFLCSLYSQLKKGDLVLIGFDLKKNPRVILSAYNDSMGVTKGFNLNLLNRINRELNANFDLTLFDHFPTYDPITGACKSYLISMADQQVQVGDETITFYQNEPVWTELSQKYSDQEIHDLAYETGFRPVTACYDCRHWFMDVIWERA